MRRLGRLIIVFAFATAFTAAVVHANDDAETKAGGDQARATPKTGLHLDKERFLSPTGARSEAGVGLSLGSHVMLQLNYARTTSVPMMGYASDNGVLARLRVGF